MAVTRRSRRRATPCGKAMMGCGMGGPSKVLGEEAAYSLSAQASKCPTATCPAYTGIIIFLLVLYGFFIALIWAFRPTFTLKAGVARTDPNSVDLTSGFLYALLFTGLVLVFVALLVRCQKCMK